MTPLEQYRHYLTNEALICRDARGEIIPLVDHKFIDNLVIDFEKRMKAVAQAAYKKGYADGSIRERIGS